MSLVSIPSRQGINAQHVKTRLSRMHDSKTSFSVIGTGTGTTHACTRTNNFEGRS